MLWISSDECLKSCKIIEKSKLILHKKLVKEQDLEYNYIKQNLSCLMKDFIRERKYTCCGAEHCIRRLF